MKFTALAAFLSLLPALTLSEPNDGPFGAKQIKTLVTFGDSTTDTVRVFNGGVQWPDYVSGYTGVKLYPYAKSGSTCSNAITPRPFLPLVEWQVPTFLEEKANGTVTVDAESTLYTLWMGTNDIGVNSILTQGNEATVLDVANCLVGWVKTMYDNGARNLIVQNVSSLSVVGPMWVGGLTRVMDSYSRLKKPRYTRSIPGQHITGTSLATLHSSTTKFAILLSPSTP